jgi:diacylglycerol kinase family enzyme
MTPKPFVCVNPASANGRTGERWAELAAALRAALGDFDVAMTRGPREAGELVRRAIRGGVEFVVSVGGDGTHNEVVQGFFDESTPDIPIRPGVALGIVPTGTGGDFRRSLGLPREATEAIACLGGPRRTADVGRLTYTGHDGGQRHAYFVNICSFGMSGLVDKIVNESSKVLGGKASFLLGVGRASLQYRNQAVRLRLDDGPVLARTVNNVAVANAKLLRRGHEDRARTPTSATDVFDVVVVGRSERRRDGAWVSRSIYDGTHVDALQPQDRGATARARSHAEPATAGQSGAHRHGRRAARAPARRPSRSCRARPAWSTWGPAANG